MRRWAGERMEFDFGLDYLKSSNYRTSTNPSTYPHTHRCGSPCTALRLSQTFKLSDVYYPAHRRLQLAVIAAHDNSLSPKQRATHLHCRRSPISTQPTSTSTTWLARSRLLGAPLAAKACPNHWRPRQHARNQPRRQQISQTARTGRRNARSLAVRSHNHYSHYRTDD